MIDLIGDIHGHAGKLKELLLKLGYKLSNGAYSHPNKKVLFVGDYIDRGPKIRETLNIVKSMVESENAIALMGNHEYNALCFHFQETEGGHLRKHLIKNIADFFSVNEKELLEEQVQITPFDLIGLRHRQADQPAGIDFGQAGHCQRGGLLTGRRIKDRLGHTRRTRTRNAVDQMMNCFLFG